jgi:histone deacetylase 8
MSPEFSNTRRLQVVNPGRATYKDLAIYHSRDYLDFVLDPKNSTRELSSNSDEANDFGLEDVRRDHFLITFPPNQRQDCPLFPGLHNYVSLVAGATLTAASSLIRHISDIAICWDGGRSNLFPYHCHLRLIGLTVAFSDIMRGGLTQLDSVMWRIAFSRSWPSNTLH